MRPPFIKRVAIKNFKSIAHCDVELDSLQFLVGRNGSGKSNFLDALMFVRDALKHNSFHEAAYRRFGVEQTLNRKAGNEGILSMELDINLDNDITGFLSFELGLNNYGRFKVIKEKCIIKKNGTLIDSYQTFNGEIQTKEGKRQSPLVVEDCLYLKNMKNLSEFQMLYHALCSMKIYGEKYFRPNENENVDDDGVFKTLLRMSENTRRRISEYLQSIVPLIQGIQISTTNPPEIAFVMQGDKLGRFHPSSMSYGTLRALAILAAIFQESNNDQNNFPTLVCIEEPETALHARAMAGILAALEEASEKRQILVTTHSTEMLDNKEITADRLLPMEWRNSETVIGPLESVSKEMLNDHLTTAGELLRQNALNPEPF